MRFPSGAFLPASGRRMLCSKAGIDEYRSEAAAWTNTFPVQRVLADDVTRIYLYASLGQITSRYSKYLMHITVRYLWAVFFLLIIQLCLFSIRSSSLISSV